MSIATATGDDGTTALMFGRRVPKTDRRIEACGSVDELNAALGWVRATIHHSPITEVLRGIQNDLVILMGEIAVSAEDRGRYREKGYGITTAEMVGQLSNRIDDLERGQTATPRHWSTPGDTIGSAALDVARTVCRRAERRVIRVRCINPEVIRYLNRLSDLCWLYARSLERTPGDLAFTKKPCNESSAVE